MTAPCGLSLGPNDGTLDIAAQKIDCGYIPPIIAANKIDFEKIAAPRRPVERNHASEDERHSDFRFNVHQIVRNPPWSVGVPINKRRVSGHEISIKPKGRAH